MRSQEEHEASSWECLRILARLATATLAVAVMAAACAALTGCRSFSGPGQNYAKGGFGSPARHNVEPMIGLGREWDTGAAVEVRYEPWLRVDEPSTRGFPRELGRVFGEVKIPLP